MKTIFLFLLLSTQLNANFLDSIDVVPNDEVSQFVEKNKELCISSWQDGVLPSIKMAQAIIESASGTSDICRKANNYFGVKCHSCDSTYGGWRIFKSKEHSFRYINRLYNSMGRYAHLIDETDIFTWATQLQDCGYASSESYPESLMYNVMLYDLYKLDSIAFKRQIMSKQEEFLLHKVGFRKDTGLNVEYGQVTQEGSDLVRDKITKNSSAKSHPDLAKATDSLRIHFAGIWKMLPMELVQKDFKEMTQFEMARVQEVLSSITIQKVTFIGADTDSKKYILSAKVELLPGGVIGAATPKISEDDSRYELSSELADLCETLRSEVFEYVFNKKYSQLSMEFDMEEAGADSDASHLEAK